MSEREELSVEDLLERITELVEVVDGLDPEVSGPAMDLLDYLEAWHREGITRLAMGIPPDALDEARQDPVVAHMLNTYLGDDDDTDPTAVVDQALEEIRPYVHTHGGEMEVVDLDIDKGVVTLDLMGACDGCPSSSVTLTQGVEEILKARWPGFRRLEVAGGEGESAPPPKLLQIQSMRSG